MEQTRFTVGKWMLAIGVVGAALALGAVDRRVMCVVVLIVTVGAALALSSVDPFRPRTCASLLLYVAIGLLAFTILQTVPLPAAVARALSPHAADIWDRCLRPLGERGPSWHPLTVDPPATHVEIVRGAAYLVTFMGSLAVARTRAGARFLVRVLIVGGIVLALGAIAHPALGLDKVYGVVRPKTQVGMIGPLLNSNHSGGYVNIALLLLASSALSRTAVVPRFAAGIGAFALVAFELWNASRGAVGSMAVGLVALVLLHWRRRGHVAISTTGIAAGIVAMGGIGMLVLGWFEASAHGMADTSLSKLRVGLRAIQTMVPAYPFFGAGRGAFEAAFPEYMNFPREGFVVFTKPENLVAQWSCEWGVVVAAAAGVVILVALRPRNAVARGEVALGPWVALAVLGLQNLVDFSSEIPGMMLALVVCAAIVTSGAAHRAVDEASERASLAYKPRDLIAAVAVVAVASVATLFERAELLVDEKPRVHAAAADTNIPHDALVAILRQAMLAHPAEPYFAFAGASRALYDRQDVLPWIERTLERAPVYAPAHLVLARSLRGRSPAHARVEYRIACEERLGASARELRPLISSIDDALEVVPPGLAGVDTLDALAALVASSQPATRERIDAEIQRRAPGRTTVTLRMAQEAYEDAVSPEAAPWCVPAACLTVARGRAAEAENAAPQEYEGYALSAKLMVESGDANGGIRHLRAACATATDRNDCLLELATLGARVHSPDTSADIDALAREGCVTEGPCVQNLLAAANLEKQRHNNNRALVFLRRATERDPDRVDAQEALAAQASASGLHNEAASTYERLARSHPTVPKYAALAAHERELTALAPK